jgi:hypothetical protein
MLTPDLRSEALLVGLTIGDGLGVGFAALILGALAFTAAAIGTRRRGGARRAVRSRRR